MPIKSLGGLVWPLAVSAFGCFHAMINSFGYIGFWVFSRVSYHYLVAALLGIYRKRFAKQLWQYSVSWLVALVFWWGFLGLHRP